MKEVELLSNLVKNGVDAIVEEFRDESGRAFESDRILRLLQGTRHLMQRLANLMIWSPGTVSSLKIEKYVQLFLLLLSKLEILILE